MDCNEIIKDIIIPILSAIIGGVFTFLGVYITIKYEIKKDKEEKKLRDKPIFYRLDSMQQYPYKEAVDFILKENPDAKVEWKIWGILKNTDNAILIIDSVMINGAIYRSLHGDVIDKNQIVNLHIYTDKKVNKENEIIFNVKDIVGNEYTYMIETEESEKSSEIISFKEIKK